MAVTRRGWLKEAEGRLEAAGVDPAGFEARQLLMAGTGLTRSDLAASPEADLGADALSRLEILLVRRLSREPLAHILGSQPFWTLDLTVTRDVLTPRADTETVVEAALEALEARFSASWKQAPIRLLDIATGSGAIALALLSELPEAAGVGTDISAAALDVARENARRHALSNRLDLVETSWADAITGPFDLVVCNPPYIASAVIDTLQPEVREYEPRLALDGGAAGLDPYRHLFSEARRLLTPGGTGVFEIGYDQGEAAVELARAAGAVRAVLRRDLGGNHRAVVFGFS